MALTYEESAALMQDAVFRGRVKVACLHFAQYIASEDPTTSAHSARWRWASNCLNQPDQTAMLVTPPSVMDAAVQQDGANVSDAALQLAVEGVVGKLL
jgi:hypothetical protein